MADEKCKHDGKPIYKDTAGAWQHERRTTSEGYTGEERRKPAEAPPPPTPQPEPKREHTLHRPIFGRKAS